MFYQGSRISCGGEEKNGSIGTDQLQLLVPQMTEATHGI